MEKPERVLRWAPNTCHRRGGRGGEGRGGRNGNEEGEREGYTDDGEEREVDVLDLRSLTRMLHAGILERLVSPPATPKGGEGTDSSQHWRLAGMPAAVQGRTHP